MRYGDMVLIEGATAILGGIDAPTETTFNTTGANVFGEYTTIPSDCVRIEITLDEIDMPSGGTEVYISIGDATGYAIDSGGSHGPDPWPSTGRGILVRTTTGNELDVGRVVLIKATSTDKWHVSGAVGASDVSGNSDPVVGYIDNAGTTIDRIKIDTNGGSDFDGGAAHIRFFNYR